MILHPSFYYHMYLWIYLLNDPFVCVNENEGDEDAATVLAVSDLLVGRGEVG